MSKGFQNTLYYGDNLKVLREHVPNESVDLIYLDPPFNSKANYNVLYKEPSGIPSEAQITAFEDSWHWTEEAENTFQEIIGSVSPEVIEMMISLKRFIGLNDMMAYLTMMCIRLVELRKVLKPTGTIYLHCDPTASHYLKIVLDTIFGKKNFRNEIIWCYTSGGVSKKHFGKKHDVILFYSKTDKYTFNPIFRPYSEGTLKRGLTKVKGKYFDSGLRKEGAILQDWWELQPILSPTAFERLGYPTQKPRVLLERIVRAGSDEGDIVLDPFCGCGTTMDASHKLGRKWIGIDVTHLAINLIKMRMKDTHNLIPKKDYMVIGEPEDLAGAMELASQNRFQFQYWALSLINYSKAYKEKKKGADTGIDGYIYHNEVKEIKRAIVQIKSGKVQAKDIRELCHVVDREKATIGVFVTLIKPTKPMLKESIEKGYYHPKEKRKKYRKIQILTIGDILEGKQPDIPDPISPYKQAKETDKQELIDF